MRHIEYIGRNIGIVERVNGYYVVEIYGGNDFEVLGIFKTVMDARTYAKECL